MLVVAGWGGRRNSNSWLSLAHREQLTRVRIQREEGRKELALSEVPIQFLSPLPHPRRD